MLFKWDLQDAMKDYPEDQHLLSRKAAKAKKEAAAKQAAAKPTVLKSEDVSYYDLCHSIDTAIDFRLYLKFVLSRRS